MAALLTRLGLSTGVRKVIQRWGPRRYLSSKLTEKWVNTPVRASKCLLGREDERSKVLMIYTGGTIGMASSNKGLMPLEGFLEDKIMNMEDISGNPKMPMVDILRWEELLDSSNMDSNGWAKLARQIEKYYLDYDGFVILHGTDTMAYSASALSFMFENLGKPVILTGSQIPLSEVYNDARRNLLVSLIFAGMSEIPEVCIFFETRLFRGNRSKKVDSQGLAAFDSPNFPPLATLRNDIRIRQDLIRPQPHRKLKIHTKVTNDIAVLHLVPGFDDTFIHQMAQSNLEGVVLHLYGTGNAPSMKASLIQAIERIRDDGTPVVAVSQVKMARKYKKKSEL
ncbi:hypothetical protein AAMO2058_001475800 [Amorphochlora amoebiformis]